MTMAVTMHAFFVENDNAGLSFQAKCFLSFGYRSFKLFVSQISTHRR